MRRKKKKNEAILCVFSSFAYAWQTVLATFNGQYIKMFSLFTYFCLPQRFLWRFGVIKIAMWLRPNRQSSCYFFHFACDFFVWSFIGCFQKIIQPYQTNPIIQVTFSYEKILQITFFSLLLLFQRRHHRCLHESHFCIDLLFKYVCTIV